MKINYNEKGLMRRDEVMDIVKNSDMYKMLEKEGVEEITVNYTLLTSSPYISVEAKIDDNLKFMAQSNTDETIGKFYGYSIRIERNMGSYSETIAQLSLSYEHTNSVIDKAKELKKSVLNITGLVECKKCNNLYYKNEGCAKCEAEKLRGIK